MSRIISPVTKVYHAIRGMRSSASRPSKLIDDSRHVSIYLPRKLSDLRAEQLTIHGSKLELNDRFTAHDLTTSREFHTFGSHRPTTAVLKPFSFTKGFRTSAPIQAAHDTSTIDFFFFPEPPEPLPTNPFAKLRVPLLPDNYTPDRSANSIHAVETLDSAVPPPEINIVASHPEQVIPAPMTEVVGNDGLDVDISDLTSGFSSTSEEKNDSGVLQELWSDFVDDVFGAKTPPKAAL